MPNLVIEATAGSGKTTTVINSFTYMRSKYKDKIRATDEQREIFEWCANNLPVGNPSKPSVAYFTYNTANKEYLETKIFKGCKAWTFHGYGQSVLTRAFGYQKKVDNRGALLVSELTGKLFNEIPDRHIWYTAMKYIEKLKLEYRYPSPESMTYVQAKYPELDELPWKEKTLEYAIRLIEKMRIPNHQVEYIDMAWLGCQFINQPEYDIGFVDECQDLSMLSLKMVTKACRNIVFCGDPNQAIMQFAGAHAHMFEEIRKISEAEKPLKQTFRCPPNICHLGNQIRPSAKMRPTKTENGAIVEICEDDLIQHLSEKNLGHSIISRTNAPLLGMAFKLLKNNVPAYIQGSDIIRNLESLVKATKATTLKELLARIDNYTETIQEQRPNTAIYAQDRADCIRMVAAECDSVNEVIPTIKRLFDQPKNASICLSSVHRSKGLEWPYVYVLHPPIPHPRGMEDAVQAEQEQNLNFVGVTRTSRDLIWVPKD